MSAGGSATEPPASQGPRPDRIAAGFKVLLGLAFGAASGYLFILHASQSWNEPKVSAGVITGMALGFCIWLLLSGGLQFRGRKWGVPRGLAVLVAGMVAGGVVEPRVLQARRVQGEIDAYAQLQASPETYEDYQRYHLYTSIPRKGVAGPMALAQVREELQRLDARKAGGVEILRRMIGDFTTKARDEDPGAMQPAIDLARDGLSLAYDRGLAELARRTKAAGATAEFPEDPRMRAAFRTILEHLARSNDDHVYLVFSSENPPEGGTPKAEGLVDPGEAFSPEREQNRRRSFAAAMTDALKQAFTEPLLQIRTLESGESREGKVVFEVHCATRRAPGEFTLTQNDKAVGKLFNLDVEWKFSIFDAGGKPLTRATSHSNPAGSFRFRYNRDDPPWSAYSVMLDSAYYNYCREITGRLGMIPPAVRDYFSFER